MTNSMNGVSPIQMLYQKLIFQIDIPFRLKEDLFRIKENPLPKNRVIGFSLDRLRRDFIYFLFIKVKESDVREE